MTGIAGLLQHKKSSLALVAVLALTLTDPSVASWLPRLSDTHAVCVAVVVSVAIVMQGAVDIAEILKGQTGDS